MKKNKHIGSNFDDFLKEEGILEEVKVTALKRVISFLLQKEMDEQNISRTEMAKRLKTSRSGLARLLDPKNQSVTLLTLNKVASVLGKKLDIQLH
jgi:antitoxin HicB